MRTPRCLSILALATLTTLLVPLPTGALADADATPDVTIIVEAPEKLLASHEPFYWNLTLTWEETTALNTTGAPTGLDLLAHIVATQDSTYTVDWFDMDGDGTAESAFVDEVNGVASDFTLLLPGYFWAVYENDESATTGINQIALGPGDEIRLTYTGWPVDA